MIEEKSRGQANDSVTINIMIATARELMKINDHRERERRPTTVHIHYTIHTIRLSIVTVKKFQLGQQGHLSHTSLLTQAKSILSIFSN